MKFLAFVLFVLLPSSNELPNQLPDWLLQDSSVQKRTASSQGVSVSSSECLSAHNVKRQLHQDMSNSNLAWSTSLASDAAAYALELAQTNTFQHDPDLGDDGENLYKASRASTSSSASGQVATCGEAINSWYAEISDYNFNTNGPADVGDVIGHFTQVVWKSTTQVGVGIAVRTETTQSQGHTWYWTHTFIVARYSPAGNYVGQYANNVKPLKS